MSAVQAPLAFVYDRCASRDLRTRRELEMRMVGCHASADREGWVLAGGPWLDRGADALSTHRPQLSALLDSMQAEAGRREVLCLVHDWGRLATDTTHRLILQQRIIEAGGWSATTFGESDRHSIRAVLVGRQS
ncbi:recombinase family protein [Streptomyces sp. NRRL S-1813]|uniref:recombinase family protein n=1 Tax=Streptomyces sp. NRRL S-1813 TaxID=1463888 RepID=UPI0004CB6C0A|nr:recombinase family protein [Streptomyces sp. NRRL S-1813]